ncbi:MAG TPA: RluA family pseudouridine synthase [Anaerolineaceae bacterium]|jgi:tRNA pseudouridine32 synthase/23S rRNA pseudouridine746 synthase|nr:RluA family pseudouridine synthase [Anaerolineaceae bacterium]
MTHIHSLTPLYMDDEILVINKPAGLPTIPDGYDLSKPCLRNLLSQQYGRVWVIHRLDKETSGVILFARTANAHRKLNSQFESHRIRKIYLALIYGFPCWEQRTVDYPLHKDGDRKHRTVVDEKNGKLALTIISVLKRADNHSLIAVEIKTGITHQIRAHLSLLGFPIIGDSLYAFYALRSTNRYLPFEQGRMYLHAFCLDFIHPATNDHTYIEAPIPAYFQDALNPDNAQ